MFVVRCGVCMSPVANSVAGLTARIVTSARCAGPLLHWRTHGFLPKVVLDPLEAQDLRHFCGTPVNRSVFTGDIL